LALEDETVTMLPSFQGTTVHKLDEKGRLVLPKKVLDEVAPKHRTFVVTAGMDGCVLMLDVEGWGQVSRLFSDRILAGKTERSLRRRFFGLAEEVTPDKAGRISLPKALRSYAGLDAEGAEAVVVGVNRGLEIWSQAKLNAELLAEPTEAEESFFESAIPIGAGTGSPADGTQP